MIGQATWQAGKLASWQAGKLASWQAGKLRIDQIDQASTQTFLSLIFSGRLAS
jgi:hypothetical protein